MGLCRFTGNRKQKQPFSGKDGSLVVCDLDHVEDLLGVLHELQVGPPPLLETEVHSGRGTERQQVLQCLHEQWEGWLEIDTLGGQDGVWLELHDFCRQRFAPSDAEDVSLELIRLADG